MDEHGRDHDPGLLDDNTDVPMPPGQLDRELSPVMFVASLLFLAIVAMLLHLTHGDLSSRLAKTGLVTCGILHVAFWIEYWFHSLAGHPPSRWHRWTLILPILRIGARDRRTREWLWLPIVGWKKAGVALEKQLHDFFSIPLMCMAVLVLPLVVMELFWSRTIEENPEIVKWLDLASSVIWMSFTIEFVLMISLARKKTRYIRNNWIDLVIIILPLFAFLRSARLARLIRLNQLSRTARVYRVRGLLVRMWRAVVVLDLLERFVFRDKRAVIERLEELIDEKEAEIRSLRARIERLREKFLVQIDEDDGTKS